MKKYIYCFLLFTSFCCFSQIQEIKVTYVKALKKITNKSNSLPKILKDLSYLLKANKIEGVFVFQNKMSVDNGVNNSRFIGQGGGKGVYYKNISKNIKLRQLEHSGKLYLKDGLNYKWKLTKVKKIINGYLCYKAIANYSEYNPILKKEMDVDIEAWYTPEISFSFGPAGYDGLPGLILMVRRGGYYFIADKIVFHKKNEKKKLKIIEPKEGIRLSHKEFNEAVFNNYKKKRNFSKN